MAVVIEYTSEEGIEWISQMDIVDGKFVFEAQGNSSETKLRNARITLSYVDGWNQKIASTLYLTQANALNELGQKVSIPELRGMSGSVIYDDIILEGYVVSDKGNPNVASNRIRPRPRSITVSMKKRCTLRVSTANMVSNSSPRPRRTTSSPVTARCRYC